MQHKQGCLPMPLDPRYITSVDLEPYLVDKSTGEPLANGRIYFYRDTQRTVQKLVYQLIDAPPYNMANSYQALPDPVIVSQNGTIQDAAGNNVALYYFPYDANGNLDLYFVRVTDQYGVEQFTREAWPFSAIGTIQPSITTSLRNQLKNPQFAFINFTPPTLVIPIGGAGTTVVAIAPEWNLNIVASGVSTVTVTRTSIAGNASLPFNPPYTLTVTPGANITSLTLTQVLENNPGIWSPQPGATDGWVATSVMLGNNSTVTINYIPSASGTTTQLLTQANASGSPMQYNNNVQLPVSTNASTSDTGFVTIQIVLSNTLPTTLSNIQVVGIEANIPVVYTQDTVNQQGNALFNYYFNLLSAKQIPSFLEGWDFPYNPAQFLGPTLAASAAGANTSRYVWDQTIVFQTTNSGIAISRATSGALRITATNASQFALIQYLPQAKARKLLNEILSVNVAANTSVVAGLSGKISLWYTTGGALPSCAANNSIVATLDATGKPATFNGVWTEIPHDTLGDAQFTVMPSATNNFNDYGFQGWNVNGNAAVTTATFFAAVVGFTQLPIGQTIDFDSISLVPGNIPTRPAPKSLSEYDDECFYYYQKSFDRATVPAQAVGFNTGEFEGVQANVSPNQTVGPIIIFPVVMNSIPSVTLYNPIHANAQIVSSNAPNDDYTGSVAGASIRRIFTGGVPPVSSPDGAGSLVHWTADARLGK